ncbi:NifB/NifX family molybdenum-iron cluster-binding protein [Methanolobus halotolerans]|uniref:Dinitrogenase iron-molybdenum cofactor biosynthesis protein n=1 Tax=Methanolobus halotolerans TaxID=2052935 RepID=A0A4E0R195_9EURY|nr:NifB/NifX family molybdenum-iron cluster-binding protein [Methanolobus halotolerans]TGC10929.1 dinitrogenase iron-molybdenum cofactor biosynthesis protein [Methanolobus halotolerans]
MVKEMKVCITSMSDNLEASIDPHFGRCRYFVIADPDSMEFESFENAGSSGPGGAGVQAAQQMINRGVTALITGSVGPNAFSLLSAEGVEVLMAAEGSVAEAVSAYRTGSLKKLEAPNSPGKK